MAAKRAKPDSVGYRPTDLATRMNAAADSGGGIKPASHPEFSGPTTLDKTVAGLKSLFRTRKPPQRRPM